jgi:hypothetical protein
MLDGDRLGYEGQMHWLRRGLLKSSAKWKFVVTPVVFNKSHKKFDGWSSYNV